MPPMPKGGPRPNSGRPKGKDAVHISLSLPSHMAEWLGTKRSKSKTIQGLIKQAMAKETPPG